MFFPEKGHGIEKCFIKKVLKNARNVDSLMTTADSDAFCCGLSLTELKNKKYNGALNWISIFANQVNGKGVRLDKCLATGGCKWYELKTKEIAEFFTFTAALIMSNLSMFKYKWVWEKSKSTNFLNAKKQPLRKHEDVCVFYDKQPVYNPQMEKGCPYDKGVRKNQLSGSYGDFAPRHVVSEGERYPTDIIYCKTAESEGPVWHPTQKPVSLGRYLIRTYSKPGDG